MKMLKKFLLTLWRGLLAVPFFPILFLHFFCGLMLALIYLVAGQKRTAEKQLENALNFL